MKKLDIVKLFIVLFVFINIIAYSQDDLVIRLSESNLNNAFAAITEARGINSGSDSTRYSITTNWVTNVDEVNADIKPNNNITLYTQLTVVGEIDLLFTKAPIVVRISGPINGNFTYGGDETIGRKLIFHPTSANFSYNGDLDWLLQLRELFVDPVEMIPPIEINGGSILMPGLESDLFTSDSPRFETTDTEIILSYTFTGPRKITVQNDFNGDKAVGTIETYQNGIWEQFNSPKSFWWELKSQQQLRTMNGIKSHQNDQFKFKNWNGQLTQTNVEKVTIVDLDKHENAIFKVVHPITVRTVLESSTGGQVIFEGLPYNSPKEDYGFQSPYQTNFGVPSSQLIGGHTYYFAFWSDGNTLNNRTTMLAGPTIYEAVLKGSQLSNDASCYNNNNQKKIVRTNDGILHMVYESMG